MLIGSAPCIPTIAAFVQIIAAHEAETSSDADALGLMTMPLSAYGIALVNCITGPIYVSCAALGEKMFPDHFHFGLTRPESHQPVATKPWTIQGNFTSVCSLHWWRRPGHS
jgi:hypothetical protein